MSISETITLWVGGLLTLMIFSFLYKDNPFYKFAEHLFVGVSAGYWMVVAFWTTMVFNMLGRIYPPSMGWFATNPQEAARQKVETEYNVNLLAERTLAAYRETGWSDK